MKKTVDVILTLFTVILLALFMLAVASPRVTDEADSLYREQLMDNTDDSWLLQYT